MEIFNKILHSYAMYYRKEMVKILKCYLIVKKSYGTLFNSAIFFGQPCKNLLDVLLKKWFLSKQRGPFSLFKATRPQKRSRPSKTDLNQNTDLRIINEG